MNREWLARRNSLRIAQSTERATSEFWKSGGLPAYIQAGCAIIALVLAILAYQSWKDQEAARRRSDIATEALKSALLARQCFEPGLFHAFVDLRDDERIRQLAISGQTAMEKCAPELNNLRWNVVMVGTFLDQDSADVIHALSAWLYARTQKFKQVEFYSGLKDRAFLQRANDQWDAREDLLKRALVEVGAMDVAELGESYPTRRARQIASIDDLKKELWHDPRPHVELAKHLGLLEILLGRYVVFKD